MGTKARVAVYAGKMAPTSVYTTEFYRIVVPCVRAHRGLWGLCSCTFKRLLVVAGSPWSDFRFLVFSARFIRSGAHWGPNFKESNSKRNQHLKNRFAYFMWLPRQRVLEAPVNLEFGSEGSTDRKKERRSMRYHASIF